MPKVLVIDDSALMRDYLQRRLKKGGYEVEVWAPNSAMEVPEKIRAFAPDLVITDYQMPGCNGASVIRMAHRECPKLPVLVLTAFRDSALEMELLRLGSKLVLAKPIEGEALLRAVRTVLEDAAKEA